MTFVGFTAIILFFPPKQKHGIRQALLMCERKAGRIAVANLLQT